jgi:peroxiredoxin (alkyl hydroperoxide reductase subunit C)
MHDDMMAGGGCCGGGCGGCETDMGSGADDCCSTEAAMVGQTAPHFRLEGTQDGTFNWYDLADYRGKKWVVLYTYPLDFTFICPTEITACSQRYADFEKLNAQVFGMSTDSVHSHKAWLKDLGELKHPLLSDMTHEVSDVYGCLIPEKGITLRATFIIDPEGKLRYASYNDLDVGRSIDEVIRVLEALQTGERCPVGWKPGEKTLGKG